MKESQKPDHVSLANTVGRLREGRYVICSQKPILI